MMKLTFKVLGHATIVVRRQFEKIFHPAVFIRFLLAASLLSSFQFLQAATLPAGFNETQVAIGINNGTAMAFAPDGRLFVCQQTGQVRVIKNGTLLPTPFLTVNTDSSGERGLLGIAFDPDFATNNFVYIYYTVTSTPRRNRISRFTANGDVAVANSEVAILELDNLTTNTNHNGGAMHFGGDGKLYVAVGENAIASNSQTLNNRLGKILRINSDGSIPTDNPFFNTATGSNRAIWALGLRNPYTFAFQPGTSRMFINDVGQSGWEEINDGIAGSNYGWPTCEGVCANPNFRNPIFEYGHNIGPTGGCAITGGAFYNPPYAQFPSEYVGKYFFADFCSGWIKRLNPADNSVTNFATGIGSPVDLQVGPDGNLYYLARGGGAGGYVHKINYAANQRPELITEGGTGLALALDSVTMMREPFPLSTVHNFSQDGRTRLMLFAFNLELLSGENSSVVTAWAEDSQGRYPLTVEAVNKVPNFSWLTQVVVRLPDQLASKDEVLVSIELRGIASNKALVKLKP
jgi:glucose/arabinose dehydrogenase